MDHRAACLSTVCEGSQGSLPLPGNLCCAPCGWAMGLVVADGLLAPFPSRLLKAGLRVWFCCIYSVLSAVPGREHTP